MKDYGARCLGALALAMASLESSRVSSTTIDTAVYGAFALFFLFYAAVAWCKWRT
jgi:hypothetical protein